MKTEKQEYLKKIQQFYKAGVTLVVRTTANGFIVRQEDAAVSLEHGATETICTDTSQLLAVLLNKLTFQEELEVEKHVAAELEALQVLREEKERGKKVVRADSSSEEAQ